MTMEDAKGMLDKSLSRFTSRKLLVWLVSTGLIVSRRH